MKAKPDSDVPPFSQVDREIAKAESQILKLKKKLRELEEVASKPLSIMKEEEEVSLPKHQSLAQKIYADNRKRALDAHHLLDKLGPKVDLVSRTFGGGFGSVLRSRLRRGKLELLLSSNLLKIGS